MIRTGTRSKKAQDAILRVVLMGVGPQGPDSLPIAPRDRIAEAREIWGPGDLLDLFPFVPIRHRLVLKRLQDRLSRPISASQTIHVLGYGDPGMNGLVALVRNFCDEERLEIFPSMDPLQEASARLKITWHDVTRLYTSFSSLSHIQDRIRRHETTAVYTSEEVPAPDFLKWIREKGILAGRQVFFFWPEKGIWKNLVSVDKKSRISLDSLPSTGLFLFFHERIEKAYQTSLPLLPAEILDESVDYFQRPSSDQTLRSLVFSKISLLSGETFWDVGAAEGTFSIACAQGMDRQKGKGCVFSVEWETDYLHCFLKNLTKHTADRLKLFQGNIQDVFHHLEDPDAVLVHERIRNLPDLVSRIAQRINPGGRILVLADSFSQAHHTTRTLENLGFEVEVTLVPRSQTKSEASKEGADFLCLVLGREKRESRMDQTR